MCGCADACVQVLVLGTSIYGVVLVWVSVRACVQLSAHDVCVCGPLPRVENKWLACVQIVHLGGIAAQHDSCE